MKSKVKRAGEDEGGWGAYDVVVEEELEIDGQLGDQRRIQQFDRRRGHRRQMVRVLR